MQFINSISRKVSLILVLCVVFTMTISGFIYYWSEQEKTLNNLHDVGNQTADRIAEGLEFPMWNLYDDKAEKTILLEMANRNVVAILVVDQNERFYMGKIKTLDWEIVTYEPDEEPVRHLEQCFLTLKRKIQKEGELIGFVDVFLIDHFARQDLQRLVFTILLQTIALALLIMALMFVSLKRIIINPVVMLKQAVEQFRGKDFEKTVPVVSNDEIGTLAKAFNTMAQQLYESFTRQERLLQELEILNELGRSLTTLLDVDGIVDEIYRGASRLLDTTNFYITRYNEAQQEITYALRVVEGNLERPHNTRSFEQGGLLEYLITNQSPLLVHDRIHDRLVEMGLQPRRLLPGKESQSWVGTPIMMNEQVIGTLVALSYTTPGLYTEHDRDLLTALANHAAIAISNAQLFEELRTLNEELEARVKQRTAELAQANAEIRELNEQLTDENLRMKTEMDLARRIQTSLLPQLVSEIHPDFEIAAMMLPADEVGGDYYDIALDREGHLWFGIGDVSGHGVTPGLIMMMAQTVHTAITTNYRASPQDVVIGVNNVLYKNVRDRLHEDHFMTFTTLKYLGEGQFRHAGAHLDLIVHRRQTGTCELIDTPGTWLNFIPDVTDATKNSAFTLEVGDTLVLYTDGLTEAWSPEKELLDVPRFLEIVTRHAEREVETMRDAIMDEVLAWCEHTRDDDMSLVVVRRVQ